MAAITTSVTALSLSTNELNDVIDLTFTYAGTTEQNGTTIYYACTLTDGTLTEGVLFPLTVVAATDIPASSEFAYTPVAAFTGTVTASGGRVYYTA
ncbi:MAG: hypothetical protein VB078_05875 [Clostridiaceae bacterium]|nr:hypothetical protein [Clostridiaceae bacterium]